MADYVLIRGNEDGNPISWLSPADLRRLLADPQESHGVQLFLGELPRGWSEGGVNTDTNYWGKGLGLLLRVEVVVPQPSGAYRLPEGDE